MQERRSEPRSRSIDVGTISLDEHTTIACMIYDLSETGVRLTMLTTKEVPNTFLLHASGFGSGVCEVAWRTDESIGARLTRIAVW